MSRAKFLLTEEDRLLRKRMQEDYKASGIKEAEMMEATFMAASTLDNSMNPDSQEASPCMFTVERYRRFLRKAKKFSSLREFCRSVGFATIPLKKIESSERDPLMRLAAVTRELGEASNKLLEAKKKDSDGGRKITIIEARQIGKEFMDLMGEASACLEVVLTEAGISNE